MIERVTPEDLTNLTTDVGSAPMQVGAVLFLGTAGAFDTEAAVDAIAERIRSVPRLRQRLESVPPGCGRPIWVDDADLDLSRHVTVRPCPGRGDREAVLTAAARILETPLPRDRPLWSATFITGLADGATALVIVFHHVMADGIGGLAVLASLVDGAPDAAGAEFPRSPPTPAELVVDAAHERFLALGRLPVRARQVRLTVSELRAATSQRAAPCSLTRPTGPRRRYGIVSTALDPVHRSARANGVTVNVVLLAAVAAAFGDLLASRDESIDAVVASVQVSGRRATTADELGNTVDAIPVRLSVAGDPRRRLESTSVAMRDALQTPRGASAALLGPAFRLLARLRLFNWFIDRQRVVHTFVTNLRGPAGRLHFLGAPITGAVALSVVTGNVAVSFAALSYAGTLTVTIITDPDVVPDLEVLRDAVEQRLAELVSPHPPE